MARIGRSFPSRALIQKFRIVANTSPQTATPGFITHSPTLYAPTITKKYTISAGFISHSSTVYAPTVYLKINTLTDNFNDNSLNSALWATEVVGGSVTEQNQRMEIVHATGTDYSFLKAKQTYDFTSGNESVEIVDAGNQTIVSHEVGLRAYIDVNNLVWIYLGNGSVTAYKQVAGVQTSLNSISYSRTGHDWLRIRESGGTIFFDYSSDGVNYTNLTSTANPFGTNTFTPQLYSGAWQGGDASSFGYFDNFNVLTRAASPGFITHSPTIYAPTVKSVYTLHPGFITHASTVYAPTITKKRTISPGFITHSPTIYAPTVTAKRTISAGFITHSPTLYSPTVSISGSATLHPGFITHSPTVYAPTITKKRTILAPFITHSPVVYAPTIGIRLFVQDASFTFIADSSIAVTRYRKIKTGYGKISKPGTEYDKSNKPETAYAAPLYR